MMIVSWWSIFDKLIRVFEKIIVLIINKLIEMFGKVAILIVNKWK